MLTAVFQCSGQDSLKVLLPGQLPVSACSRCGGHTWCNGQYEDTLAAFCCSLELQEAFIKLDSLSTVPATFRRIRKWETDQQNLPFYSSECFEKNCFLRIPVYAMYSGFDYKNYRVYSFTKNNERWIVVRYDVTTKCCYSTAGIKYEYYYRMN